MSRSRASGSWPRVLSCQLGRAANTYVMHESPELTFPLYTQMSKFYLIDFEGAKIELHLFILKAL